MLYPWDWPQEAAWTLTGAGVVAVAVVLPGGTEQRMPVERFREWLTEEAKRQEADADPAPERDGREG